MQNVNNRLVISVAYKTKADNRLLIWNKTKHAKDEHEANLV